MRDWEMAPLPHLTQIHASKRRGVCTVFGQFVVLTTSLCLAMSLHGTVLTTSLCLAMSLHGTVRSLKNELLSPFLHISLLQNPRTHTAFVVIFSANNIAVPCNGSPWDRKLGATRPRQKTTGKTVDFGQKMALFMTCNVSPWDRFFANNTLTTC